MNTQEKHLLINAINIQLERLHTILDAYSDNDQESTQAKANSPATDSRLIYLAQQERSDLLNNLEWIESVEAGICKDCGEEIPIQRLLNLPTSRSCKECAGVHDG